MLSDSPAGYAEFASRMLAQDITARVECEEQLRQAAVQDALTGLPNRNSLAARLEHAIVRVSRTGRLMRKCGHEELFPMKRTLLALPILLAAFAPDALAFCVHNELKDKSVTLTQEDHPDWKRQENRFKKTVAPGTNACCEFKNLDCNPNGRQNSLVGIEVVVVDGDKALKCGPAGTPEKGRRIKVSGDGTMRIVPNPKADKGGTAPYIVRVWTHDKQDVTGPSGLPCR